jgi:hypothetical protein
VIYRDVDLDDALAKEHDIEELRRVALALHAQTQELIRQLRRKCDQLAFLTGNKDELQQTLALIEQLTLKSKAAIRQPDAGGRDSRRTARYA